MASTYLTRTQNGTVTNNKIATFSFWIKRSGISSYQDLVSAVSGGDYAQIQFTNSDTLSIFQRDSSSTTMQVVTTRVFRDTSAWSHILVALDTTQATASDRVKIYINGVQETSFSTATYPAQNLVLRLNTASHAQSVGAYSTSSNYIDGSMSHFHFVDGTAYAPTVFGETDATTGEWKINTSPSITMGNNGFTILKDGNTITDQSSNSNNFTLGGGTLTNTEDCPSNNFATLNPLIRSSKEHLLVVIINLLQVVVLGVQVLQLLECLMVKVNIIWNLREQVELKLHMVFLILNLQELYKEQKLVKLDIVVSMQIVTHIIMVVIFIIVVVQHQQVMILLHHQMLLVWQ